MDTSIIKSFSVSGNEISVEEILSELKFISKIKETEKINVRHMKVCGSDFISRFYRSFDGESRDNTFDFIKACITKSIDLAYYYMDYEDKFHQDISALIFSGLGDAKIGLINLAKTYADDRMFTSKLETLIDTLEVKVKPSMKKKCNY